MNHQQNFYAGDSGEADKVSRQQVGRRPSQSRDACGQGGNRLSASNFELRQHRSLGGQYEEDTYSNNADANGSDTVEGVEKSRADEPDVRVPGEAQGKAQGKAGK